MVVKHMPWAEFAWFRVSGSSLSDAEREKRTQEAGVVPYLVDAADLSRCHQERLYWLSWELDSELPQAQVWVPHTIEASSVASVTFAVDNPWDKVVSQG